MLDAINFIYLKFNSLITEVYNKKQLEKLRIHFLGKSGLIQNEIKKISTIAPKYRKKIGFKINQIKNNIQNKVKIIQKNIEERENKVKLSKDLLDVTLSGRSLEKGKMHPITHTVHLIKNIFTSMGFNYIEGPDIESEWYNFTALNMPKNHPARKMHDTFYIKDRISKYNYGIKNKNKKNLLRTHTSNVQIRYMLKNTPPFKIFSIGTVYRSDYDATHSPMFHQLECLAVDKKLNLINLKEYLQVFLKLFFNSKTMPIRFRSSYFPFTEPSFEVDIKHCKGVNKKNKISYQDNWLEIMGCGMVNNKVFNNVNIDSDKYQGFAFGVGIERLAMLKYNIPDLRSFFKNDIRWLRYYGF